jgi:hypothetical protein
VCLIFIIHPHHKALGSHEAEIHLIPKKDSGHIGCLLAAPAMWAMGKAMQLIPEPAKAACQACFLSGAMAKTKCDTLTGYHPILLCPMALHAQEA